MRRRALAVRLGHPERDQELGDPDRLRRRRQATSRTSSGVSRRAKILSNSAAASFAAFSCVAIGDDAAGQGGLDLFRVELPGPMR